MARVATVAYESPKRLEKAMREAKPLRWHRQGETLTAQGERGVYQITRRPPDRRHGVLPWVLHHGSEIELGFDSQGEAKQYASWLDFPPAAVEDKAALRRTEVSFDKQEDAARFAKLLITKVLSKNRWKGGYRLGRNVIKYDLAAEHGPAGAGACHNCAYTSSVKASLTQMGSPSPDDDVARSSGYIAGVKAGGLPPETAAAIIYGTLHHGHPKQAAFTEGGAAREAATPGEWEVVVMGVPPLLEPRIASMAPGRTSKVGDSLTLHGFYDDEKAAAVARRITGEYGLIVTSGPKRWTSLTPPIAAERRSLEANDSSPVCQPFTRNVRDPTKFSACMALAKQIGPIENSKNIYDLVRQDLQKRDQECFVVACIDFRGQVRDYAEVALGQRHRVSIDVEDILAVVITSKCDGFVVAHNHPSGIAEPSEADGKLTQEIEKAAKVACPNVRFVDHLIVGMGQYYSFTDRKLYKAS